MQPLDLILVNPSMDWEFEQKNILARRVNPTIPNQESPHIGIAYLIAVAKQKGFKIQYIDMVMDKVTPEALVKLVAQKEPALVGFTAYTVQINAAGFIADAIKKQCLQTRICIGGSHATVDPFRTLEEFQSFDFVICGEGENTIIHSLENILNNRPLPQKNGIVTRDSDPKLIEWDPIRNLDDLPHPAWESFDLEKYGGVYPHQTRLELPMLTGRGCSFKCIFCCRSLGSYTRRRSVESVIGEIGSNKDRFGCESISFLDSTFVTDRNWTEQFCSNMIKQKLNQEISWSCETRADSVSPALLKLMRKAGCYYIFYGFESADDTVLSIIKKRYRAHQIKKAVKWTREAGIVPVGAFIIGLPGDNEKSVSKAIELGKDLNLFSITFPMAVPFPGTELREMALKRQYGMRIMSANWDDYGKQDCCILESDELSQHERKSLQRLAYQTHPKKNFDNYMKALQKSWIEK